MCAEHSVGFCARLDELLPDDPTGVAPIRQLGPAAWLLDRGAQISQPEQRHQRLVLVVRPRQCPGAGLDRLDKSDQRVASVVRETGQFPDRAKSASGSMSDG